MGEESSPGPDADTFPPREAAVVPARREPYEFRVNWGHQWLEVADLAWARAIRTETGSPSTRDEDAWVLRGLALTVDSRGRIGRSARDGKGEPVRGTPRPAQPPVAAKVLAELLLLELPVALYSKPSFGNGSRLVAMRAEMQGYAGGVTWAMDGLCLSASGQLQGPGMLFSDSPLLVRNLHGRWLQSGFSGPTPAQDVCVTSDEEENWGIERFRLEGGRIYDHAGKLVRKVRL